MKNFGTSDTGVDPKARVHRLCARAGMLESFLIAPEELTNDQVMELLKIAFRQPEVALALAKDDSRPAREPQRSEPFRIKGAIIHRSGEIAVLQTAR